jgi:hypothetical protein
VNHNGDSSDLPHHDIISKGEQVRVIDFHQIAIQPTQAFQQEVPGTFTHLKW